MNNHTDLTTENSQTSIFDRFKKFEKPLSIAAAVGGYLLGRYLGRFFFLVLFAVWFGAYFPGWYVKKFKTNNVIVKLITWSNIISWIIPLAGLTTGIASIRFGNFFPVSRLKYRILGIFGISISLIVFTVVLIRSYYFI